MGYYYKSGKEELKKAKYNLAAVAQGRKKPVRYLNKENPIDDVGKRLKQTLG